MNRPAAGWTVLRVCIGLFFLFEGIGKYRWFGDTSILYNQLTGWQHAAAPGSISAWYLDRIALRHVSLFARLVPLGEMCSGLAMIAGYRTGLFALVAFFMALNFEIANGAVFKYSFLTYPYGLPVLGATLALTLAGSMRSKTREM